MRKNVDEKVDKRVKNKKDKTSPYVKGKFPHTVYNTQAKKLYVRKSESILKNKVDPATGETKIVTSQRQHWRICEPQTRERAKEILADLEKDLNFKRTGRVKPLSNFAEICDAFGALELTEAQYEKGLKIAGRRSLDAPRAMVKIIKEYFGSRDVNDITFGDLEEFKNARIKTPVVTKNTSRPRSIRTVNYEIGFLRQIFNFAYRRRYVARSPFADGQSIIDTASESRRHVIWSHEEEQKALALCNTSLLAHMKVVIICITDGGFRRGELLNLKWSEVDFARGVMPAKTYKGKNLVVRPVYMTERMRETLLEWGTRQKKIRKVSDPSFVIGYSDIKNAWHTIKENINRPDLRVHDLRHVFGTRLLKANVPVKNISILLGHSSISTTEIYLNLNEDDLRESVKVLDKMHAENKIQD